MPEKPLIRRMTDIDMLTDVSWIDDPKLKQPMGKKYIAQYGQCYNNGKRFFRGGVSEDV